MGKSLQDLVDLLRDYPKSISEAAMDWTVEEVLEMADRLEEFVQDKGSFY